MRIWFLSLVHATKYIGILKNSSCLEKVKLEIAKFNKQETTQRNRIRHFYKIGSFEGFSGRFSRVFVEKLKEYIDVLEPEVMLQTRTQYYCPPHLMEINNQSLIYKHEGGQNVTVYVLDSGVNIHHPDFENRAKWGYQCKICSDYDETGHGTHVAGLIGSRTFGVAKKVQIVSVKVFELNFSPISRILAGLQWAVDEINSKKQLHVINLSFGTYSKSVILDAAIKSAIEDGKVIVAAAGDDLTDGCQGAITNVSGVVVVGSSNKGLISSMSNYGDCITVWAPGIDVYSLSEYGVDILSGSSMSTGIVSGSIALKLSKNASLEIIPKLKNAAIVDVSDI